MTQPDLFEVIGANDRPTEFQLRRLLERDWRNGALVFSRGGKISRLHYTQLLGITPSNAHYHLDLFRDYETRVGSTVSETSRRVVAARKWLESAIADGTLELRDGKIPRQKVAKAAGCAIVTLSRDVGLRALISEFDQKVEEIGYRPRATEHKLQQIRELLSGTLLLAPNRMSIDRVAVSRAVDLPVGFLSRSPYLEVMEHFEALLLDDIMNDPSTVLLHGRIYEFALLSRWGWSDEVVLRVAKAFRTTAEGLGEGTAKNVYQTALLFLEYWYLQERGDFSNLRHQIVRGEPVDSHVWENLAWAWHDHDRIDTSPGTHDVHRSSMNTFLDALSVEGLVPALGRRLTRRRGRRDRRHRPTVAEASNNGDDSGEQREFIVFASGLLDAAAARYGIDLDGADSSAFITSLSDEVRRIGPTALEDPAATIARLLRTRLSLIQTAARNLATRWRLHYEQGQSLLAAADDVTSWKFLFDIANQHDYAREMRRLLPTQPERRDEALANLLAIAVVHYDGLLPSAKADHPADVGQFFQKRYLEFGGLESLDAYLRPHNDAVCASLTDYLVESGSNLAVGRTLFEDALEESDLEGHTRITGLKSRAKGKPIFVDLETSSPCVVSLKWLHSSTAIMRDRMDDEADKKCLFLVRIGERCQAVTEFAFNDWLKRLVSGTPELAGLYITPAMLRASVLLLAALENDGRIRVGMAIGQHTEQVTLGYQQRGPVRMIYDAQIRIFQNLYETLVIHESRSAIAFVGRGEQQVVQDTAALRATGLGPLCRNYLGKPGHEGTPCPVTDCWNDCPQLLFVAESESVAAIQIWKGSLQGCQGDWERDHPERWEAVWLPWLCLAEVVEEKMVRGPLIKAWNAGTALREKIEAGPRFSPPRPW